jgi:hypothetical protein
MNLPDAMQPNRRVTLFLLGFWSVMIAALAYDRGRAANSCDTERRAHAECQARLDEERLDTEEARVRLIAGEAAKCRQHLKAQADLRCRICEASHVCPAAPPRPEPATDRPAPR